MIVLVKIAQLRFTKILTGWNEILGDILTRLLLFRYGYFITVVGAMLLLLMLLLSLLLNYY